MKKLWRIVIPLGAAYAAGIIGFLFVGSSVSDWYASLVVPSLAPPVSFFLPVWLVLYALMGIAGAILWIRDEHNNYSHGWLRFYFVQLLFNAAWIAFFFGLHSITLALFDVLILFFMVVILTVVGWEIDKRVGYFMLPYALWLLFVAYLTASIWFLN